MTYSIGAYFDHETELKIDKIWEVLANTQIADYLHLSNNRPHITLSIFDNLDLEKTSQLMCELAEEFPVMDISFQSVGIFPSSTVFLAPLISFPLMKLQLKLHKELTKFSKLPESPYFLPDQWVPHCSVAIDFHPEKLISVVQQVLEVIHLPLDGKITELGLTSYRPVVHLMKCELAKK
jgi:2'-5' RNA ligase